MRRALALLVLTLCSCPKREEAKPAPESKASAAPEIVYPLEALTCRDGVLGSTTAAAASAPASNEPSAAPSAAPSSVPLSMAALLDAGLLAPIGDGGFGLGLSGIGGLGSGRPSRLVFPLTAEPTDSRGPRALAVAKSVCAATDAIKRCHAQVANPTGTLEVAIVVKGDRGESAKKIGGSLTDETLTTCVGAALVAANYDTAAAGTTNYKLTFEPMKRVTPPALKETTTAAVAGPLPPEVIRRIVRSRFALIRSCYEKAMKSDPKLAGNVKVAFTIEKSGAVSGAAISDGTITDTSMRSCIVSAFSSMKFPEPDGAVVSVTYPIEFAPN